MASLTVLPGGRWALEPPPEFTEGSIERAIFRETAAALETELAASQERAEQWLHRIYGEIEDRRTVSGSPQRAKNQRRSR